MSKTAVNTIIARSKRRVDYDIVDSDLDTLLLDIINDCLTQMRQWLFDAGLFTEISASASFQTQESQAFRDITKAVIRGDVASFTGTANDKIKVTIDGTDYDNIDVSASTTIALVVAAINSATSGTQASETTDGFLQIKSETGLSTTAITIADGSGSGQTVIAELFSDSDFRSADAITDLDEIVKLSERNNDLPIDIIKYTTFIELYVDPTAFEQELPDDAARFNDRIYFGPTPSTARLIYIEYEAQHSDVAAGDTLPFKAKYDPIVIQFQRLEFLKWKFMDSPTGVTMINQAEQKLAQLKRDLITVAAKDIGKNRQTKSRREPDQRTGGPRFKVT